MSKYKHIFAIILILIVSIALSLGMLLYACNKAGYISLFGAYTVKYHNSNGKTIKTFHTDGGFAKPPKKIAIPTDNVFLRWNKDILNIFEDTDIYPTIRSISKEENVIYLNAEYVKSGEEFQTDLFLGGEVDFSDLSFSIQYDKNFIQFIGSKDINKNMSIKTDTDNAVINVQITANENIKEGGILAKLDFKAVGEKFTYTELKITIDSVKKFGGKNERVGTDCTMYNGKIYIY